MFTRLAGLTGGALTGLRIATSGNAELFRKSGPRDPYQIPTRDLSVLGDPATALKVIIKDGCVHKNTL